MTVTTEVKPQTEILKQDALGRVRVPASQRETILDAFERSGMNGQAFARQIGVKYPTFATWVQKRRRHRGEYGKLESKSQGPSIALVEAVIESRGGVSTSVEVETVDGLKVRVRRSEEVGLAVELLRALNR